MSSDWDGTATRRFSILTNDVEFVEEWMRTTRDGRLSEHYWITHLERLGGGVPIEAGARLSRSDNGEIRYELFSDRLPLAEAVIRDRMCTVRLTDGSTMTLLFDAAPSFVFHSNVIGQLARFLQREDPEGGERSVTYFSPEALATRTLAVEPVSVLPDSTHWRTSLGADITTDAAGRMTSMSSTPGRFTVRVEPADFPIVDLPQLRSTTSTYSLPAELDVAVSDRTVATPNGPLTVAVSSPKSRPRFERAVFIQGSGRHDRHGMTAGLDLGTHELCDRLSAAGLEIVRYDSRGSGSTPYADLLTADLEVLVTDAIAASSALDEEDASPVFLIGHSLGALIAMLITIEDRLPVAGLVLLAPAGRPLGDLLIDQADRESARLGMSTEEIDARHAQLAEALRRVREEEDDDTLQDPQLLFGGTSVPLLRELLRVDPAELLPQVSVPILICQGSKDIQVSVTADTMRLLHACEGRGLDAYFVLFPDVDHLLMEEPEASTPQRYFTRRPISSAVIDHVVGWIRARSNQDRNNPGDGSSTSSPPTARRPST